MIDQKKNIISFNALPEAIADWLNSDDVFKRLLDIENAFKIPNAKVRVIPIIVSKLVTGSLAVNEASSIIANDLGRPPQGAESILVSIKEKILNPISIPLKRLVGIDLSSLPGMAATEKETIQVETKTEAVIIRNSTTNASGNNLEPLIATPQRGGAEAPARPQIPGMETAGLRVMKDVKPPVVPTKPVEVKKPEPAPKTIATVRPFMLHEEKPVAPNEPAAVQMNRNFSFDVGAMPISRTPVKPVAAQLNPSSEAVLEKKKAFEPVVAKTTEQPKVVHYTSMRTPLSDETPKG